MSIEEEKTDSASAPLGASASVSPDPSVTQDMEAAWAEALQEQQTQPVPAAPVVERPALENFKDSGSPSMGTEDKNLDMILDIPVVMSMEVGQAEVSIRTLMKLTQGSVIELNRFAGDPLDVYVNGTLIAHGEVVVINEKFGLRLTDIISAAERVKKLE